MIFLAICIQQFLIKFVSIFKPNLSPEDNILNKIWQMFFHYFKIDFKNAVGFGAAI